MTKLSVAMLMRAPSDRSYSIEAVFEAVKSCLPDDVDAEVVVSPYPSSGFIPRVCAAWRVRQATRFVDVVHMTGDAHFLLLFIQRKPTVLTIHDCNFLKRSKGIKRFLLWLFWVRLPAVRAKAITVVSEATKNDLSRWLDVDAHCVEVIDNPLSKSLLRCDKPFSSRPNILMLGTGPHKNIERVATALAGLPCTLTIIGRLEKDRVKALQANLDVVVRYDLTDEQLADVYSDCDILMFPSLSEGFGLPILEAQSVGRLVITSNRPPMSDVAGEGALMVDPDDATSIRAAVDVLIADSSLRDRLRKVGFENVKRYRPERAANAYAALYRRIASKPS